jgi:hypothetical protein
MRGLSVLDCVSKIRAAAPLRLRFPSRAASRFSKTASPGFLKHTLGRKTGGATEKHRRFILTGGAEDVTQPWGNIQKEARSFTVWCFHDKIT